MSDPVGLSYWTDSWDGHVDVARRYITSGLNQYESAGGASFCYDDNGNLTADGGSVYLYDFENRLVEKRVQTNTNCTSLFYKAERWRQSYAMIRWGFYYTRDWANNKWDPTDRYALLK